MNFTAYQITVAYYGNKIIPIFIYLKTVKLYKNCCEMSSYLFLKSLHFILFPFTQKKNYYSIDTHTMSIIKKKKLHIDSFYCKFLKNARSFFSCQTTFK